MTAPSHEGSTHWYWLPTVANVSAPTVAEIAAGIRLPDITNYDTPSSENEVDTSNIDTTYDTSRVGTTKIGPFTFTFNRDLEHDADNWDLLSTYGDEGFLVRSPFGPAIATRKVMVYGAQIGQRMPDGYTRNTTQKWQIKAYVPDGDLVDLDAVVA